MYERRARSASAAARSSSEPGALLRAADRDARRLHREGKPWSKALSIPIRAGVAAARGDRCTAARLFAEAITQLEEVDMNLYAAAARRRLGEIVGGDEGRAHVDQGFPSRCSRRASRSAARRSAPGSGLLRAAASALRARGPSYMKIRIFCSRMRCDRANAGACVSSSPARSRTRAQSGNLLTDLSALRASSTVAALKTHERGADLVSLFTSDGPNPSSCGVAYVMTSNSTSFAPFGYSVVERLCASSNLSFVHEIGHNMGAAHDPYVSDSDDTLFPYSHGYVNLAGRIRTIMAYNDQCAASGFNCTRIPYFSTPDLMVGGQAIGDASMSNNASTLGQTASTVASLVQAVTLSLQAGVTRRPWQRDRP